MFHRSARLAAIAVGVLSLTLTACSGDSETAEGSGDLSGNRVGAMENFTAGTQFTATTPLSFSMLYSDAAFYPMKDDWLLWSEITKRTGVTLEPTVVPAGDYEQKRSLLIGAGDAPLIIPKTYPGQETPFIASGAILPIDDYLDLMPNLQEKIAKWNLKPDLDGIRQANGKLYVLPGVHEDVWPDYTLAMRTDILQDLNLTAPKTWDEVREVLAAMKQAAPNSYPLSDQFNRPTPGGSLLNIMATSFGTSAGWGYQNSTWDPATNKFVLTGAMDQYKQMLEYLNGLFKDGLLDPEGLTQDDPTAQAKLARGQSFVISTNAQTLINNYRGPLTETTPDATLAKIPVPAGPLGDVKSGSRLENGIMISAKAKDSPNFVAMMQFIDWLWYSDVGQEFAKWGVEGVTYTKDATGKRTLTEDIDFVGLNPGATKHLQKDFGFQGGVFAYGGTTELLQSTFSAEEVEFQTAMATKRALPIAPPHPLTEEEQEEATLTETPLKDFVNQQTLQFILGQRDFAEWDAYVSELNGKAGSYLELINTAYERFAKEFS